MNFELHHNCSTGIKFFTDNSQVCFFFMVDLKDVKITKSSDFNTKKKNGCFHTRSQFYFKNQLLTNRLLSHFKDFANFFQCWSFCIGS